MTTWIKDIKRRFFLNSLINNEKKRKYAGISLTYQCPEQCTFCYSKELSNIFPQAMSPNDFKKILIWLIKQKFNCIGLVGGEPTCHPDFGKICEILHKTLKTPSKTKIYLMCKATSLSKNIIQYLLPHNNNIVVQLHISVEDLKHTDKKTHLYRILEHLNSSGIPLLFRTVLKDPGTINVDYKDMINFMSPWSKLIRFSFDSRSELNENKTKDMARGIIDFINQCCKKNIYAVSIRPIPKCFFNRRQILKYRKQIMFNCTKDDFNLLPHFIINPDLSCFLCCSTRYRIKNILQYNNTKELRKIYSIQLKEYFDKPAFDKCLSCKEYTKRRCLGSCLGHRISNKEIIDI